MKYLRCLFVFVVLSSCNNDDYENPEIEVSLNVPFKLRNTSSYAVPKGNVDIAVYPNRDQPKIRFELVVAKDFRCSGCIAPSTDYYVLLLVNNDPVYLGNVENPNHVLPNATNGIKLATSVMGMTLELLGIEHVLGSDQLNQTANYKEVTLRLIQ